MNDGFFFRLCYIPSFCTVRAMKSISFLLLQSRAFANLRLKARHAISLACVRQVTISFLLLQIGPGIRFPGFRPKLFFEGRKVWLMERDPGEGYEPAGHAIGGCELSGFIIFPPPPSRVFANLLMKTRLTNNLACNRRQVRHIFCLRQVLFSGSVGQHRF